jgi:hypothetical protein
MIETEIFEQNFEQICKKKEGFIEWTEKRRTNSLKIGENLIRAINHSNYCRLLGIPVGVTMKKLKELGLVGLIIFPLGMES